MRKHLTLHVLIISFVFLPASAIQASDVDEAIESYKQAIRINPDGAEAHYFPGRSYVSLKDKDSALEQHKILKRLDFGLANELFNIILAYK